MPSVNPPILSMSMIVQAGEPAVFLHIPFRISAIPVYPAAADGTVHSFRIPLLQVDLFLAGRTEISVQPHGFPNSRRALCLPQGFQFG